MRTERVKVSPHRSLNSKKGVLWCRELDTVSLTEIKEELASQQVTEVKRISVTRAGKKENTHTYILTFGTSDLPTKIKVGYLSVPIKPYIPNPLRCFRCQRFGHHRDQCRSPEVCGKCGNTDHSKEHCDVDPACVNCKGKHEASSKNCPSWKKEKEISRIKTERNLPYPQARKVYESLVTPASEKSFVAAVAQGAPQKFKSVGVQTDLSSKDEGKVLAPSKKLQTSQTSNPQDQLQTNLTNLTKKTLGEAKSRSPKTITNNQNMGNRFEALSVESDESAMETENSSGGLESRSRSLSPRKTRKGGPTSVFALSWQWGLRKICHRDCNQKHQTDNGKRERSRPNGQGPEYAHASLWRLVKGDSMRQPVYRRLQPVSGEERILVVEGFG